jgi:hypothetical protein
VSPVFNGSYFGVPFLLKALKLNQVQMPVFSVIVAKCEEAGS